MTGENTLTGISLLLSTCYIISEFSKVLPLHAEEESVREQIAISGLISSIDHPIEETQPVVMTIIQLYRALGLIDEQDYQNEILSFVSFPASLLARSITETLGADGQKFFSEGYWLQEPFNPDGVIEEQRNYLQEIEKRRLSSQKEGDAPAIRTVHVAWGIVKLHDRFLLHAREDKARAGSKRFVFPGGRLSLVDLEVEDRNASSLQDLFRVDSTLAQTRIDKTLQREIEEELGIRPTEYEANHICQLAPYRHLEGPRNHICITQYNITLFQITISEQSEIPVLKLVAMNPDQWAWFSAEQLIQQRNALGQDAFIEALLQDKGTSLKSFLTSEIDESSSSNQPSKDKNLSIELRAKPNQPIIIGQTGRERATPLIPDESEWALLMCLAWHSKEFKIAALPDEIQLLGAQWVQLISEDMKLTARGLAERCKKLELPLIEYHPDHACRLMLSADLIFFSGNCFQYEWDLDGQKDALNIKLKGINATYGSLLEESALVNLSPNLSKNISLIEVGGETSGDIDREQRTHFASAKKIGLRRFLSVRSTGVLIDVPPKLDEQ